MKVKTRFKLDSRYGAGFWVMFATVSAASMAYVASSSLAVALPAIQQDLGARAADLIWISYAYVLVQASLIVVSGSLGDHYGRNRICILGLVLFGLASAICGLSTSTYLMIAGRFFQGIGGALIIPNSLAICSAYFSGEKQGLAIGIWTGLTTFIAGAAPYAAGILTDLGMWRAVFYISLPLGLLSVFFFVGHVPESFNREAPKRMSLTGAALVTAGLGGIAFGFIESSAYGFLHPFIFGAILIGILSLAYFLYCEKDEKFGILPVRLFKSRNLSAGNLNLFVIQGVFGPVFIYLPINLIQIQDYSATATGLAIIPMTLLATLGAAIIGPFIDRHGPRLPLILGTAVMSLGYFSFTNIGITGGSSEYFSSFFLPISLFGVGLGFSVVPSSAAALGSAPKDNAGIASGVHNTMSRGGQVLVVGILGGLAITWFGQQLTNDPYILSLPKDAQIHLAEDAKDMAETSIPETLPEEDRAKVKEVIRKSFTTTFSAMMWVGALTAAASAIICFFLMSSREWNDLHGRIVKADTADL